MGDLAGWLKQQLDDDEREIAKHPDGYDDVDGYFAAEESNYPCLPMLTVSKRFALAEIDAKRRILDRYERALANRKQHRDDIASAGALLALLGAVKDLAQPYAGRPGYREEWRPA